MKISEQFTEALREAYQTESLGSISEQISVDKSLLSKILSGKKNPTREIIDAFCEVYGFEQRKKF